MKITERLVGDVTIIDVQGRIMFGDGEEEFKDAISRVIESGRVRLLINMAEVPHVDSVGINQVVRTYVSTRKRGGQMKLLKLSKRVRELLAITRLLTVFEAFESEEEAVASFDETSRAL